MRERNRVSYHEAMKAIASDYTPKQWENEVASMLRTAVRLYGNQPPPNPKTGKQKLPPDAGFWRDIDKSNPEENKKRMPGKLDFEYWRVYKSFKDLGEQLILTLPVWKRSILWNVADCPTGRAYGFTLTLDIECKTGEGRLSPQQRRTVRMSEMSPGRHPLTVYPSARPQLERILGIVGRIA